MTNNPAIDATIDDLAKHLSSYRLRFSTESQLQGDVANALSYACRHFIAEHQLSQSDRIDFYVPSCRVGIECKIAGSAPEVYAQCLRYAEHESISGLILVTRRKGHVAGKSALRDKPFRVVWVGRSGL